MKNHRGPSKNVILGLSLPPYRLTCNENSDLAKVWPAHPIFTCPETVTIGKHKVAAEIEGGDCLTTYWPNPNQGLMELAKHASEVFNSPIHFLTVYRECYPTDLIYFLNYVNAFQGTISTIFVQMDRLAGEDLSYFLQNCMATKRLDLTSGWLNELPISRVFSIEDLRLRQANWFTLEHLLLCDTRRLVLKASQLTSQDLNAFVKGWINGECSRRTEFVSIYMLRDALNHEGLLEGIEVIRRDRNVRRRFYVKDIGAKTIIGGMDIRRKHDGAMATIVRRLYQFKILFWPDWKDNAYH